MECGGVCRMRARQRERMPPALVGAMRFVRRLSVAQRRPCAATLRF
jgi:hypothetical protein